jgi:hypothetical protein
VHKPFLEMLLLWPVDVIAGIRISSRNPHLSGRDFLTTFQMQALEHFYAGFPLILICIIYSSSLLGLQTTEYGIEADLK